METDAPKTYEEAMQRLETIVKDMENGTQPLDALSAKLKEAQSLAAFCQKKLAKAESDIEKLMNKA